MKDNKRVDNIKDLFFGYTMTWSVYLLIGVFGRLHFYFINIFIIFLYINIYTYNILIIIYFF